MRVSVVLAVVLCAAGVAHAQFAFGPNGVTHAPINLLSVYKFASNLWSTVTGSGESGAKSSVKVAAPDVVQDRQVAGGGGNPFQQNSALQNLKSRIQAASNAAVLNQQPGVDPDSPLTRAILLPKKKLRRITFGKWPVVYGVLNGLLLAAAIHLALPYFKDGETILEAYSDSNENEYGYHPHMAGYPGLHMPPVTIPVPTYAYNGKYSPHLVPHSYSSHMKVLKDQQERHKHDSHGYHVRSDEVDERPRHKPVRHRDSYESDEVPLNELHYYNPTVFTSNEPSSYACMERMVCMNPSRTARMLAISNIGKDRGRSISSDAGKKNENTSWQSMIQRLDQAAEFGKRSGGSCEQYYCPPQLPNLHDPQLGDQYAPPPKGFSFEDQRAGVFDPTYLAAIRNLELQSGSLDSFDTHHQKSRSPSIIRGNTVQPQVFFKDFDSSKSVEFLMSGENSKSTLHRIVAPQVQLVQAPIFQDDSDEKVNTSKIRTSQYAQVSVQTTGSDSYESDDYESTDHLRLSSKQISENAEEAIEAGEADFSANKLINF